MKIIKIVGLTLVVILSVSFLFIKPLGAESGTIKIGVLAAFNTIPGDGIINAAKFAVEDINNSGGILGKKVEIIIENSEFNPQKGIMAFKKLVLKDGVKGVIGESSSGVAKALMDQLAQYKVPTLNTVASPELSKMLESDYEKYKYWFRCYPVSNNQAYVFADFLINYLNKQKAIKKVAIMPENALWTKPIAEIYVEKIKEAGLELVYYDYFDLATKDFTPIFTKIMAKRAEVILQCTGIIDSSIFIKQWADLHGPIIMGNSVGADTRFWKNTDGKCVSEIHLESGGCLAKKSEKTIPFYNRYKKVHGDAPPYTTGYAYDAFFVFKEAVERARSTDPDALVKELEKTDCVGTSARYVYLPNHDPKHGPGFLSLGLAQWREDGTMKIIWPQQLKNAEFIYPPWYKK